MSTSALSSAQSSVAVSATLPQSSSSITSNSSGATASVAAVAQKSIKSCAYCNNENAPKLCPCKTVRYCTTQCQSQHWKVHKKACTILKKEKELDKYLVWGKEDYFGAMKLILSIKSEKKKFYLFRKKAQQGHVPLMVQLFNDLCFKANFTNNNEKCKELCKELLSWHYHIVVVSALDTACLNDPSLGNPFSVFIKLTKGSLQELLERKKQEDLLGQIHIKDVLSRWQIKETHPSPLWVLKETQSSTQTSPPTFNPETCFKLRQNKKEEMLKKMQGKEAKAPRS